MTCQTPARISSARALIVACLAVILAATARTSAAQDVVPPQPAPPAPAAAPLVQAVEVGAALGGYDRGLGTSNDQFVRYRLSRINDFSLALDAGREHRFAESSLRGGISFNKSLPGGPTISAGWSSGSGDVLAPRYRVDVGVMQPIHDVLTTVSYTRLQSKAANRSDGYAIGLVRYFSEWIVAGNARLDVGTPGRTISTSAGIGATWYRWKKIYIGGELTFGDVSYMLLPGDVVAVDYRAIGGSIGVSRWFDERSGINVRATYGDTDIYRTGGIVLSLFREF